jgi:hypothetical protein
MSIQAEFKCEQCRAEGFIQTTEVRDPDFTFCPVCGVAPLDLELIEFEIQIAGEPKKPKRKRKKGKSYYKPTGEPRGPKPGTTFITTRSVYRVHSMPEKIEIVELEYRQMDKSGLKTNYRPFLSLNCGYKAVSSYVPKHIHRIHGVPLEEAKEMCKMENVHKLMEARGITEYDYVEHQE